MTLTHYIGGKLTGLTADFPPSLNYPEFTTFINTETFIEFILVAGVWTQVGIPPVILVGGWKEIGRTTLGAPATAISVAGLADKRYLMFLYDASVITNTYEHSLRLNNESVNYAYRKSTDGGAETVVGTTTSINIQSGGTFPFFSMGYLANLSTREKLMIIQSNYATGVGAGTAPSRTELVGKHAQATNPIDRIDIVRTAGVGSIDTGSELVVLGWDPTDVDTDNFWEEIGSANLSGGASNTLDVSIGVRKYLWFQAYIEKTGGTGSVDIRVGSGGTVDTGNVYSLRNSIDGGADGTAVNRNEGMTGGLAVDANPFFINGFFINNVTNDKLGIFHYNNRNTAGAGTPPQRLEGVGKWANTTNQIDILQLFRANGTGTFGTGSFVKVWGHD